MELNKEVVDFIVSVVRDKKVDIRKVELEYRGLKRSDNRNYEWGNRGKVMGRILRGEDNIEFGKYILSKGIKKEEFFNKCRELKGGNGKGSFLSYG